jgi:hypothetical protein
MMDRFYWSLRQDPPRGYGRARTRMPPSREPWALVRHYRSRGGFVRGTLQISGIPLSCGVQPPPLQWQTDALPGPFLIGAFPPKEGAPRFVMLDRRLAGGRTRGGEVLWLGRGVAWRTHLVCRFWAGQKTQPSSCVLGRLILVGLLFCGPCGRYMAGALALGTPIQRRHADILSLAGHTLQYPRSSWLVRSRLAPHPDVLTAVINSPLLTGSWGSGAPVPHRVLLLAHDPGEGRTRGATSHAAADGSRRTANGPRSLGRCTTL